MLLGGRTFEVVICHAELFGMKILKDSVMFITECIVAYLSHKYLQIIYVFRFRQLTEVKIFFCLDSVSNNKKYISFLCSATLRVAGALQQSTEVMKAMQELVKLPDINKTMMDMSREMMKAGIIEEMVEDTMDMLEPEELEEEAQQEVDKVRGRETEIALYSLFTYHLFEIVMS